MLNLDIAIIINSFNRFDLLKECLRVLSDWIPGSSFQNRFVAVVYDAGSVDGSVQWLVGNSAKMNFPIEVILPKAGDDTSFAAGLNTGIQFAKEKFASIQYLLLYETDNQILEAAPLEQALAHLESIDNLAACGFTVRKHDGSPAGVGQPFPTLFNFALGKNIVNIFQLEAVPYCWERTIQNIEFSTVDVVYTSPLLVRLDAWIDSGGLDANLFPFSDCDVDWARRLRDKGWRMGVIRTDKVVHDNLDAISAWSKTRAIQNHRGRLRYFRKHRNLSVLGVWPLILMLRHLFELIATKIFVKDPQRRHQLSIQYSSLLKSCPNRYE